MPGNPPSIRSYTASFTFAGVETLTVKAGTFQTARMTGTVTIDGESSRAMTLWFAPDIGRVKIADSSMGTRELVSTNLP